MKDALTKPFVVVQRRSRSLLANAPVDLFVAGGFAVVATVALALVPIGSLLVRSAIGVPLLLFVPGYVTLSVFFPRDAPVQETETDRSVLAQTRALSDAERAAVSFGLSFAVLPLLGLAIAATPRGFTTLTVVGAVGSFSVLGSCLGIGRRLAVPASERYRVGFGRYLDAGLAAVFDTSSTVHAIVNVALAISILLSLATVGYALVAPQQGERYTDLRLLTEDGSGELVAAGYPEQIEPGESIPLVIAVENQEREDMEYTVVVQEQRVEDGEVVDRAELQRIGYTVDDGQTGRGEREITPTAEEGDVRIAVLLYQNDVPATPTIENAYRYTHVWTEVSEDDGAAPDEAGGGGEDGSGEDGSGEDAGESDPAGGGEDTVPDEPGDDDADDEGGEGDGDEGADEGGEGGGEGDTGGEGGGDEGADEGGGEGDTGDEGEGGGDESDEDEGEAAAE